MRNDSGGPQKSPKKQKGTKGPHWEKEIWLRPNDFEVEIILINLEFMLYGI